MALVLGLTPASALAQRADENPVRQAEDAFGLAVGSESTGLYSESQVRGFSPVVAGNARIEGLYFDRQGDFTSRLIARSTIHVGLTARGFPFSAPTGVVDYAIRPVGERFIASVVGVVGGFGSRELDADMQAPVTSTVAVSGGVGFRLAERSPGDTVRYLSKAVIGRWRPSSQFNLRLFWSRYDASADHATPQVFPLPGVASPPFRRAYYGQAWALGRSYNENLGLLIDADVGGGWGVRAGLFRSIYAAPRTFEDLYENVDAVGVASDHVLEAAPGQGFRSTSGEIRLSRTMGGRWWTHLLYMSVRARRLQADVGGSDAVEVGQAQVGRVDSLAEPRFDFGSRGRQSISQTTLGIQYDGRWGSRLRFGVGVERSTYRAEAVSGGGVESEVTDTPWLVTGSATYALNKRIGLYGGYASGLEQSGVAPPNATNFGQLLPAGRTWQRDFAVRALLTSNLRLVAGVFEIHKPYFNLDQQHADLRLGEIVNRGVELSVTGTVLPRLELVAGAVFADPTVRATLSAYVVGHRPIAMPRQIVTLNADYLLPDHRTSLDVHVNQFGRAFEDTANLTPTPAYATLDVGIRYRLRLADHPATVRGLIQNVGDVFAWQVLSGGAMQPIAGRRALVQLTADF